MTNKYFQLAKNFCTDESGASMVEYGIALLVSAALGTAAMTVLGGGVAANVTSTCLKFSLTC